MKQKRNISQDDMIGAYTGTIYIILYILALQLTAEVVSIYFRHSQSKKYGIIT